MRGELRVGLGIEVKVAASLAAELIDRVVPAPEDGVVLRQSVVVELVARIGDTFSMRPADALHLGVSEGFCDKRIVIDGSDILAGLANERGEHVGRKCDLCRGHGAVRRVHPNAVFDVFEPLDF